jgi:hypothetical protein
MQRRVAPVEPTGNPQSRDITDVVGVQMTGEYLVEF